MRQRVHADHAMSSLERMNRSLDRAAMIDSALDEAKTKIDIKRREECEQDPLKWIKTYCVGLLLDDDPPELGESVILEMVNALKSHDSYNIEMGRGQGKSSYILCCTLWALALGVQSFVVIVSQNSNSAKSLLSDLQRAVSEPDTNFAVDYPEIVLPYVLNPRSRRQQTYRGKDVGISKNSSQLILPTIEGSKASSAMVQVRGWSSGIRGIRRAAINGNGSTRPTAVILDDLQDSETAHSQESVNKLLQIVKSDIFGLAGKSRMSILQSFTPICADDYVHKCVEDKKTWKTSVYKSVISYPSNDKLWQEYFALWDDEAVEGRDHAQSLAFYRQNFDKMNEGAKVFNPSRYDPADGHISAVQKMMELRHTLGEAIFDAEYQMQCRKTDYALEIRPQNVIEKISDYKQLEIPDDVVKVIASSDLNVSHYITTFVCGFSRHGDCHVLWQKFRKCRVDQKLSEAEYDRQLYALLADHGKELSNLGIKIDCWVIDGGGTGFNAVTEVSKHSNRLYGIPTACFMGKASHVFSGFVKSRLRDEVKNTVLCGDPAEHAKSGSGKKYTFWNSDHYREMCQKAILQPFGSRGSCDFYLQNSHDLTDLAIQITNEQIKYKRTKPDGRVEYYWKSQEPHDCLDALAQSFACFWSLGVGLSGVDTSKGSSRQRLQILKQRRLRII